MTASDDIEPRRAAPAAARPRRAAWALAACALAACALAAAGGAAAQTVQTETATAERSWRGFASLGLTRGGDTLAVVSYVGLPDTTEIRAGQQIDLRLGIDWKPSPTAPFALQAGIGYFAQSANGLDGTVKFERYPLELIGFWQPAERWRVGLGVRRVGDGKLDGNGVAQNLGTLTLKGKVGAVVEGEFMAGRSVGLGLRYVAERYTGPGGEKLDGNHVGLRVAVYF